VTDIGFHFDIGEFECTVVSDGTIAVPSSMSQGTSAIPKERTWENMDIGCMIIRYGQHKLLIDTGCGDSFQPSTGKLIVQLEKEGIKPAEIDTIIHTHGHTDHVGGTVDSQGELIFPNARQVVSKREWKSWVDRTETTRNGRMFDLAVKNLLPIPDQFNLVEDDAEVERGIKLLSAPGHTLGSVIIEVSSGKDKLLCIGDLIHSELEFSRPEYYAFLDSAPEAAIKQRTEGLLEIAKSGTPVFACHFPFPGIGKFTKKGNVLAWQPTESRSRP